ncbi:MAG: ExbD/TolR family protein [Candidatus Margulisiibacteriota bacterium]
MKIPSPQTRKKARIEIIPLIDIVFFLLATFVMVSMAMVKNQGVPVQLPTAKSAKAQPQHQTVTLSITASGTVYLNKTQVSMPVLQETLTRLKNEDPGLNVIINGDKDANLGKTIRILDAVRQLGISKVAIRTQSS